MEEDNEFCEKHCKGYRDTGGRCFADGRCDAYWEYQKQKGTMIKKAELTSISTFVGTPPFHNDMNILIGIMIDGKLITHTHCLPRIIAGIFKQMPGIKRQEIASMFAHEIVREVKLNNCLEFGEIDMSDVFEVLRLKYPMLVMSFLDGISVSQNL